MRSKLTIGALVGAFAACSASTNIVGIPDSGGDPPGDGGNGPDAGRDAGPDAGDAGLDAGDAGPDGGDAGLDAGDAGPIDAGPVFFFDDAGFEDSDAGLSTRYPIVLAHGFGVFAGTEGVNFYLVLGALQDAGFAAFPDGTDAFNTVAARGAELLTTLEQVTAETGAPVVNIIAHSMGGLDARYVASAGGLGRGDLIATISTVSTPHQGSEMADFTLMYATLGTAEPAIGALESAFGIGNLSDPNVIASLQALSVAEAPAFNAATPNDSAVMYQSWAGVATAGGIDDPNMSPQCGGEFVNGETPVKPLETLLVPTAAIVGGLDDEVNDGFVAVDSAHWGAFRGCVPSDHLGEPGGTLSGALPAPDPDTGWNYVTFYLDIARDLAARGY